MNVACPIRWLACTGIVMAVVLSGCTAPPPRDFGGAWRAVNRFDASPQAISLQRPYEFFASPLDGTLKAVLTRWAKDTGRTLAYQWPEDYTLPVPASDIHTGSLDAALARLGEIYAAQGMAITAPPREIRVAPAADSAGGDARASDPSTALAAPAQGRSG